MIRKKNFRNSTTNQKKNLMAKKLENEFENEVDEFLQPNIDINKSIERQKTCF